MMTPGAALGFYLLLWAVILFVPFIAVPLKRIIADLQLFIGVVVLLQALLMVLVSLAFIKLKGFAIPATLSFKPTRFSLVLWGALGVVPVGMISGLLFWPLVEALPGLVSKELEFLVRLSRFSDLPTYLFYALALSVGPAISEELAFRGVILQGLRSRLGAISAVTVTAVLFGVIHLDILQGLGAIVIGLYLGYLTVRSGSIVPAMVAHGVNNLWSTVEASLWQAAYPQMSPRDILLSTGYPWWVYGVAGAVLIVAIYAFHRATRAF
ncbi:MAG: CPBP family intramembrane metalloprotease [Candidatus Bipolaricaulota bacterium]|nr:CPBP family intramembrane metalloprotease [Candidatus Bipolaricaulota bacterium]